MSSSLSSCSSSSSSSSFDLCLVLSEGWPDLWPAHVKLMDAATRHDVRVSTCSWNAHLPEARGKVQDLARAHSLATNARNNGDGSANIDGPGVVHDKLAVSQPGNRESADQVQATGTAPTTFTSHSRSESRAATVSANDSAYGNETGAVPTTSATAVHPSSSRPVVLLLRQPCDYILYGDAFQRWLRNPIVSSASETAIGVTPVSPMDQRREYENTAARSAVDVRVQPPVKVLNEAELCIWNMRKEVYLMDLAAEAVQITPTVVLHPATLCATTRPADALTNAVNEMLRQLPLSAGSSDGGSAPPHNSIKNAGAVLEGADDVVVVKPSMSVGSIGAVKMPRSAVAAYVLSHWQKEEEKDKEKKKEGTAAAAADSKRAARKSSVSDSDAGSATTFLAQSYVSEAHITGEFSAVFFNNRFSHCLTRRLPTNRRSPQACVSESQTADIRADDCAGTATAAVSAIPYNGDLVVVDPAPPRFVAWATHVMQALQAVCTRRRLGSGLPPVYARVDGIPNSRAFNSAASPLSSAYFLLELELIEPSLGLDLAAGACDRFLAAIEERVQQEENQHRQQVVNLLSTPRLAGGMRKLSHVAGAIRLPQRVSPMLAQAQPLSQPQHSNQQESGSPFLMPFPRVHRASVDSLGRLLLTVGRKVDYLLDPQLRASYARLPLDPYVQEQFRRRRYSRMIIGEHRQTGDFQWSVASQQSFTQSSTLNRAFGDVERVFAPVEDCIINSAALKKFVMRLIWPHFRVLGVKMEMGIHQIRITYRRHEDGQLAENQHTPSDIEAMMRAAMPTPEGLHRDGFHFVAMGCVQRDPRLEGGLTEVFPYPLPKPKRKFHDSLSAMSASDLDVDSDSESHSVAMGLEETAHGPQVAVAGVHEPLLRFTLMDGDFALIDDVGLQHQVSPIYVPYRSAGKAKQARSNEAQSPCPSVNACTPQPQLHPRPLPASASRESDMCAERNTSAAGSAVDGELESENESDWSIGGCERANRSDSAEVEAKASMTPDSDSDSELLPQFGDSRTGSSRASDCEDRVAATALAPVPQSYGAATSLSVSPSVTPSPISSMSASISLSASAPALAASCESFSASATSSSSFPTSSSLSVITAASSDTAPVGPAAPAAASTVPSSVGRLLEIHRDMLILTFTQLDMPLFSSANRRSDSFSLNGHY